MARLWLLLSLSILVVAPAEAKKHDKKGKQIPWVCDATHKDCPSVEVEKDESPAWQLRHYNRSTWAISCVFDVHRPDGVFRANAKLLDYLKENNLSGGAPYVNLIHMSLGAMQAWERSIDLDSLEEGGADNFIHKTVCAAYFLPHKYQNGSDDLGSAPPKPGNHSGVFLKRVHGFDAYTSGFPGFPLPPRFILSHMRLVYHLKWESQCFNWETAAFMVYNGPEEIGDRWNEVLIPAGHKHMLDLVLSGEDVYPTEDIKGELLVIDQAAEEEVPKE